MNVEERTKAEHDGVDVDALLKVANDLADYTDEHLSWAIPTERMFKGWADTIRNAVKGANPSKSRELPEGVEWPRFEGGELVKFGNEFVAGEREETYEVVCVKFHSNGEFSLVAPNGHPSCFYTPRFRKGEPVKRPEPEVLDADGVPIKVGDTVYYTQPSIYTKSERIVDAIVGKEVHFTNGSRVDPSTLTHRKPDSFEAIRDDVTIPAATYCVRHGLVDSDTDVDESTLLERHILHLLERQRKLIGGK